MGYMRPWANVLAYCDWSSHLGLSRHPHPNPLVLTATSPVKDDTANGDSRTLECEPLMLTF